MTDWAKSGRIDDYSIDLVDPFTLRKVGEADFDAEGSSIAEAYYSDNFSTASIKLEGSDYVDSTGQEHLLRVQHRVRVDGADVSETLGTFFVDSMSRKARYRRQSRSLDCYSTLLRSTADSLVQDFGRARGANVVAAIRSVIEADGGHLRVMQGVPTSRTFGQPIAFEIGTRKSTVASTMAGWIGCTIGVGADGYVELRRYQDPSSVGARYVFTEGAGCVYKSGIPWTSNRDEVLNRVVMYFSRESKQDGDPYPLTDRVMVDLPESNRFSYERVGRRKSEVVSVSEPCSHADLLASARQHLAENSGETLYIEVEHVQVPGLHAGDVVEYRNDVDEDGLHVKGLISQMEIPSLGPGCMCKSKIKITGWLNDYGV